MDIRPSPIAGRWYPGQPEALRARLDPWLRDARAGLPADVGRDGGRIIGMLVPHAGHAFSGAVAAQAFGAVLGEVYDVIAIVCPSHYHADGPLLTSAHAAYATPLGVVPVDREALSQLGAELGEQLGLPPERALVAIRNDREHAIEIELPFLQRAVRASYNLLPIMQREQGAEVARALGQALASVLESRRALLVASSDLSHFYSRHEAERLDGEMLRHVAAFDAHGVLAAQAEGRGLACGSGAIAAVMWAAQRLGAERADVLGWSCSGDVNGDNAQVVGYGAAILWQPGSAGADPGIC
jgi:MEMO1 family protein